MNKPGLISNFVAEGAVSARRIVKFGTTDAVVALAAAVGDLSIGISTDVDAVDAERCDVILSGAAELVYGAAVTRGERLTSDASGRGVPVSASTDIVIGKALVSGVTGDIGSVNLI